MRDSELIVRAGGEQQIFYAETFLLNSSHSENDHHSSHYRASAVLRHNIFVLPTLALYPLKIIICFMISKEL